MRILVVEDEPAMVESLTWGLEQEGYVVVVAAAGETGLWLAREADPDVIILDVMLPGLNGSPTPAQAARAPVTPPPAASHRRLRVVVDLHGPGRPRGKPNGADGLAVGSCPSLRRRSSVW